MPDESGESLETRSWQKHERLRGLFLLVVMVLGLLTLSSWFSLPIDDAFISFRYLDNWVHGRGLVFNPGERVEGYSNLLWIAVLAPAAKVYAWIFQKGTLDNSIIAISLTFEFFLALGSLFLVCLAAQKAARRATVWNFAGALLLAGNGLFLFWIGKGLEVIFYSFLQLVFAALLLLMREREKPWLGDGLWLGLVAAAITLTRPEAVVPPAAVLLALALADRGRRLNPLLALAVLALAVADQFVFRLLYYRALWPNTYYAKRLPLDLALDAGLDYLRKFAVSLSEREAWFYPSGWLNHLPAWVVCAVAWSCAARQWRRLWPIGLQMLALAAVAVYVGGDWMPAFRFLVPAVPLGCLLVGVGLGELAGARNAPLSEALPGPRWRPLAAAGLLAMLLTAELLGTVAMIRSHEFQRWRFHVNNYGPMAKWMKANAPADSLVALSDIGIISYFNPAMRFIDVLGLTDPHIAALEGVHYRKTDVEYVLSRRPDYVLVMLFAFPDEEKVYAKTRFDAAFLSRVAADKMYEKVARVNAWREGLKGERWVLFEVYRRTAPPSSLPAGPS